MAGFWDLASQACAEASTGIVYVYMTPDRDADQRNQFTPDMSRPQCTTCWFRKEKPALINNLRAKRVTQIVKYHPPSPGTVAGNIVTMNDKF